MKPAAPPPPAPAPSVAPPGIAAELIQEANFQDRFKSYRTAVATGNEMMERMIRPHLLKDREAALRLAEKELARAATPYDREVAERTLESLRR